VDLPCQFTIRESSHRIHNPFTSDKLATLGQALDLRPGARVVSKDDFLALPELLGRFGELGCDVVEMVLASQDSWDRYVAAQWLNIRRWLDRNPGDELAAEMRAELDTAPAQYARYEREYVGWGVFALMDR
jgi:hypothetical protein